MIKTINIPSLGNTAHEVLKNALAIETAGYLLKFRIVGEATYYFNPLTNKFNELWFNNNIPFSEPMEDNFDGWLLNQISKGYVDIWVESAGKNPHYSKEYHRARGTVIPMGDNC